MMSNIKFTSLIFIVALLLVGCSPSDESLKQNTKLRPVRTIPVELNQTSPLHEFPGVVDAANSADLSFKVSGEVTKLVFKQGEDVIKGQVIATLDKTDYKLSLEESQASFEKAQADFNRAKQLIKTGTISQSDYDKLKAQFAGAKTKLSNAKNNLAYTELHASFNGVIARTHIEQFEEVQAKQTIVTLQDIHKVNILINVPESVMIKVSKQAPKQLFALFAAIPDKKFPLKFVEVSTKADEATKTYELTLGMDPPSGFNILPGMTARVMASKSQAENGEIHIPIKTVLKDAIGNYVWTVKPIGDGKGQIIKTRISVGDISKLGFRVKEGLEIGMHVVTAGMSKVTDGQHVKFEGE